MKRYPIQFLQLLFKTIIFWIVAFSIFIFIRYFAIGSEEGLNITTYHISDLLYFGAILGVLIGVLFAVVEFVFDNFLSKNLSLALVLLQKFLFYFIGIILSLNFMFPLAEIELNLNLTTESGWWKTSKIFWVIVGYFFICSLIFSFIKIANEKFGRGVFFNLIIGKYRKPQEEKRIFMFIDLQGSTTIAEKLGHYKYSELIQECFNDLNRIIANYSAEIYQYVGDEVVLSWKYNKGLKNNNCVKLFYKFQKKLSRKEKKYIKRFGLLPKFKAGIHGGNLIVTEVGIVKKEIAYHGDVINTAARIQGQCNNYNATLLISKLLLDDLNLKSNYIVSNIGDIDLKGKQEKLQLFSIDKNSNN